ncbi:MAG: hypothetical protein QNJ85_16325 [Gammaproteobacteria bacterium]|nr:hypothetical protein [Gammaproteobacteria bacterium]
MIPLYRDQREPVIETLRQLKNFGSWTMMGDGISAQGVHNDSVEIALRRLDPAMKVGKP